MSTGSQDTGKTTQRIPRLPADGMPRPRALADSAARIVMHWFGVAGAEAARIAQWPLKLEAMPALRRTPMAPRQPESARDWPRRRGDRLSAWLRRLLLVGLAAAQTVYASFFFVGLMPHQGEQGLELVVALLFAALFFWVSIGFWTAIAGTWICLTRLDRFAISRRAPTDPPSISSRTAVVMPIYNEPVDRVFAGLRATLRSIDAAGLGGHVHCYVLSDSTDPDIQLAEELAWAELIRDLNAAGRVHYRRRRHHINRKTGNIADFCRRWGARYDHMMVLDADSVMEGRCLRRLIEIMEANPQVGILQTAPVPTGRQSLFARVQQFASRLYAPVFSAGLHYWQLGEAQYWGHNALVRLAPFIRYCGLSRIPGRGPLSGAILSHDFVEAALMRRAGWQVWIVYDIDGSYEEPPSNFIEELIRDRRWCEGNLQHLRLFNTPGLHPAHRAGFLVGVMAYLSAPLWFLFLFATTGQLTIEAFASPQYFPEHRVLFPDWPIWRPELAVSLLASTIALLIAPKILAAIVAVTRGPGARAFGGWLGLSASLLMEILVSSLLAPLRMVAHTVFVIAVLLGIRTQWGGQSRADGAVPWEGALRLFALPSLIAIAWGSYLWYLDPAYLWWSIPVLGPLVVAVPLAALTASRRAGRAARRAHCFLSPEESNPPAVLSWTAQALAHHAEGSLAAGVRARDAVRNPCVWALHTAITRDDDERMRDPEGTIRRALDEGPDALSSDDWRRLLSDNGALSTLYWLLQMQPELAHAGWGVAPAAPTTPAARLAA
jgi:membrane glycosyltransferase